VQEEVSLPVRVVTCFSSELYRQKLETLATVRAREKGKHAAVRRRIERRTYRCAADAQAAADDLAKSQPWTSWTLTATVRPEKVTTKRTRRGRPRRDDPTPPEITLYRLVVHIDAADEVAIDRRLRRSATYTLIRNRLPGWEIEDKAMVGAYADQWRVEHGFSWLKSRAAINPMFLETDHRIEALCLIYHLALVVQTIVQRNVRRGLSRNGWKLPYHRNKPSDRITARFTFELFRNVTSLVVSTDDQSDKRVFGDNEHTRRACLAIGVNPSVYRPVLHEREIRG